MADKSGYSVETIRGVEMFVCYAPIHAISTTWVVLSFQPYDQVFSASKFFTFECIYNESHSWWREQERLFFCSTGHLTL